MFCLAARAFCFDLFLFHFVFNGFEYGAGTFKIPEWIPQAFKCATTDFLFET